MVFFAVFWPRTKERQMYSGTTIFSQIMKFLPRYDFDKCVNRYRGNYKVSKFPCIEQFYCMAFAQLTYRESLRDIEACLDAIGSRRYHMGIRFPVSRSTLADANEQRNWRIYADFAQVLIHHARKLYANEELDVELSNTVYALDSTTIDLSLTLFPWATFRSTKSAVKMHTLLDLRGPIPTFIQITDGSVYDVNILDELILEPGSFYVMDRGYLGFKRLYRIHTGHAFFMIRSKSNTQMKRRYSAPVDKEAWDLGVRSDQTVILTEFYSSKDYPEPLRRIRFLDIEQKRRFTFLTNNFQISALTCAKLYKSRWAVELFFKWIKQHLRIKAFYGISENAVKTQIWIAVTVYVLIAIIRKELGIEKSLYNILQIFSLTQFEKMLINQVLTTTESQFDNQETAIQLNLFDL